MRSRAIPPPAVLILAAALVAAAFLAVADSVGGDTAHAQDRSYVPVRGEAGDLWADVILGKPDFTQIGPGEVVPFKLFNPGGIVVDRSASPGRAYVWDAGNSRILGVDLAKCYEGESPCSADVVLGQPSLYDHGACNGDSGLQHFPVRAGATASTLCGLHDTSLTVTAAKSLASMAVDANGALYAPDYFNNRVLRYDDPFTTDAKADAVWGQRDFSGIVCNQGEIDEPNAQTLCFHSITNAYHVSGVEVDAQGNLWVADSGNNRVLRFRSTTSGVAQQADLVLGQEDFDENSTGKGMAEMHSPSALRFGGDGELFVADAQNKRVLVFEPPFESGMRAKRTLGKDFGLPVSLELDAYGRGVWVNDPEYNMVTLWDWSGENVLAVVGKDAYEPDTGHGPRWSTVPGGPSFGDVTGIALDAEGNMLTVLKSGGHDVLRFPVPEAAPDASTGILPDKRLFFPPGGSNNLSGKSLREGTGVAVYGDQLVVADYGRLLFWNGLDKLANGQEADGVVGNRTGRWHACCGRIKADDAGRLWVLGPQGTGFVDVYQLPLHELSVPVATLPLGDAEYPVLGSERTMKLDGRLEGIAPASGGEFLWVSDKVRHRVLRIRNPLTSPEIDVVLGQVNTRGNTCNRGSRGDADLTTLCSPGALSVDRLGNLYVSDQSFWDLGNRRLLVFEKESFPEDSDAAAFAAPADKVFRMHGGIGLNLEIGIYDPRKVIRNWDFRQLDTAPWEPAFDSTNRMVVGYNMYAGGRRPGVYDDPLTRRTQPTEFLRDIYSNAYAAAFDENDNLYVLDRERGRALVYRKPFRNPPSDAAPAVPAPLPDYPASVEAVGPLPPSCVLREAGEIRERLLELRLTGLPDEDDLALEFRKPTIAQTQLVAIHGGWASRDGDVFEVDAHGLDHWSWNSDGRATLTVRVVRADGTPLSAWSAAFLWAESAAACASGLPAPPETTAPVGTSASQPVRGESGDLWADVIIGQRDFSEIAPGEIAPHKVFNPGGVVVDRSTSPGRAYVWDAGNSRILGIDLAGCYAGESPCSADVVLGQPEASGYGACNGDSGVQRFPFRALASAETLCGIPDVSRSPAEHKGSVSMAIGADGALYVPDSFNNRVLRYDDPFGSDSVADAVWGQADFAGMVCNRGDFGAASAETLCFHANSNRFEPGLYGIGVEVDAAGNLWVADSGNNRVLRFPTDESGEIAKRADLVLGQQDFEGIEPGESTAELHTPSALRFDSRGNLYVVDTDNDRVLAFHPPFTTGMAADGTVGSSLHNPVSIEVDPHDRGLWVNDQENGMIELWGWDDTEPLAIIGKSTYEPEVGLGDAFDGVPGAAWLWDTMGIAFDAEGNLLAAISAYAQDVLRFPAGGDGALGSGGGIQPDKRLFYPPGGSNLLSLKGFLTPRGIVVHGDQLIVSDRQRILYWNGLDSLASGQEADGAIGNEEWRPYANCCGRIKADEAGRLWTLGWEGRFFVDAYQLPLHERSAPVATLWTEDVAYPVLGSEDTVEIKGRVFGLTPADGGKFLWLSDTDNHRVLRIRDPLTDPVVDVILGQLDAGGTMCNRRMELVAHQHAEPEVFENVAADMLCFPGALSLDRHGNLYVSDNSLEFDGNRRLLIFPSESLPADNAEALFAVPASKAFDEHGRRGMRLDVSDYEPAAIIDRRLSGPLAAFTWEPAFDSTNRMAVGYNMYGGGRFVGVYDDPLGGRTQPDAYLRDVWAMAYAAAFDANDNLYVSDLNRGRVLIYHNPFGNPAPVDAPESAAPAPLPEHPVTIELLGSDPPDCLVDGTAEYSRKWLGMIINGLPDNDDELLLEFRKVTAARTHTASLFGPWVAWEGNRLVIYPDELRYTPWDHEGRFVMTFRVVSDARTPLSAWSPTFVMVRDADACIAAPLPPEPTDPAPPEPPDATQGPVRGEDGDLWADVVVGKPDFTQVGPGEVVPFKVFNPGGVAVDRSTSPGRAYVWDSGNSRILGIDLAVCYEAEGPCSADVVLGQPAASDYAACNGDSGVQRFPYRAPASAETLCGIPDVTRSPASQKSLVSMAVDGNGALYAPDSFNHRVLRYDDPFGTDAVADGVWGQSDFAGMLCNRGDFDTASAETLCFHSGSSLGGPGRYGAGVELDSSGNLWVADSGNNRVLRFPADQSGAVSKRADLVIGQQDFQSVEPGESMAELHTPSAVRFDADGSLYVVDTHNDRVLVFHAPFATGMDAASVLGSRLSNPVAIEPDPFGRGFWVNDRQNGMIELWAEGDREPVVVVGKPSYEPDERHGPSFASVPGSPVIWDATGFAFDAEGAMLLAVTANSQDVLRFPADAASPSASDFAQPDRRLFYPPDDSNLIGPAGLDTPRGVAVHGDQLIVSDYGRLMYWNSLDALSSGRESDGVLSYDGWRHWQGCCGRIKTDGAGRLWVLSWEGRRSVSVFDLPLNESSVPLATLHKNRDSYPLLGTDDRVKLGDRIFGLAPTHGGRFLWLSDTDNHQVLRIRDPLTDPVVDVILGQPDAAGTKCNHGERDPGSDDVAADMLCFPGALSLDRLGNLYVSDHALGGYGNHRLLLFPAELLPADNAQPLFAVRASKTFDEHGGGDLNLEVGAYEPLAVIDSTGRGPRLVAAWEPAFDSTNRMVVGYNMFGGGRFPGVYHDPLSRRTQTDAYLRDLWSTAYAATFDTNDNLYIADADRGRLLVYLNPFDNPPAPPPEPVEPAPLPEAPVAVEVISPEPPQCVLRESAAGQQRLLTVRFASIPSYLDYLSNVSLEFRDATTFSTYEVDLDHGWVTRDRDTITIDVRVLNYAPWGRQERASVAVRLLYYYEGPISPWSAPFLVARNAAACAAAGGG